MKGLLQYLVSSLVDHPDSITIRETVGQKNIAYVVFVHPDDMGKVIGKGGRIANALRVLMRAAGGLHDKAIWVDFNRQASR
ncbi:MAG TPA: KH domain-containing protein [Armatimonadota bacterium]|nr:KH domain-containing protein [Armatimonadota bacterium]